MKLVSWWRNNNKAVNSLTSEGARYPKSQLNSIITNVRYFPKFHVMAFITIMFNFLYLIYFIVVFLLWKFNIPLLGGFNVLYPQCSVIISEWFLFRRILIVYEDNSVALLVACRSIVANCRGATLLWNRYFLGPVSS